MERPHRKERIGVVVSDKMDKTRVIEVKRILQHPKYRKYITKRKKFYAHDKKNESSEGDLVRIRETRPLSKLKRWRIVEIIRKAKKLEK